MFSSILFQKVEVKGFKELLSEVKLNYAGQNMK